MKKRNKHGISLRISLMLAFLILCLGAVLIAAGYRMVNTYYISLCNRSAHQIVKMAASLVDGDHVADYPETGVTDEAYDRLQSQLNALKSSMESVNFLYVFVPGETSFTYVIEAYDEADNMDEIAALGDVYEYGSMEYKYLVPDIRSQSASTSLIIGEDVGYGRTVTAWEPVFNSEGRMTAMVEADYTMDSINESIRGYMVYITAALILILLLVFAVVLMVMRSQITLPLVRLTRHVDSYEEGAFRTGFKYGKNDEIQWLADSFHDMDQRIHEYIGRLTEVTAEKERIGAELDLATKIQASMLPNIFPPFPDRKEFSLFASMTPAREVGGDFYDFFMVDNDHLALVIGDVSGKGVAAALFMVITKTLIKNRTQLGESPKTVLEKVNNQLCEGNDAEMFVTAWIGVYEISTGKLTAANAGHEYPAVCRKGGHFERYQDRHGFVLAGMEDMRYAEYELTLESGDILVVYTDGVTEAVDGEEKLFTEERMLKSLEGAALREPEELLKSLKKDIDTFTGDTPQFDDITMLCLKRDEEVGDHEA